MTRILAIESSCDETGIAVVDLLNGAVHPVAEFLRSQIDIHEAYGGVVPEVAAREHLEIILPMLSHALSAVDLASVDAIAVTRGPGLAPALRVGVETAKALAYAGNKPLVPVCHLEGHIYASWISNPSSVSLPPEFPALALIVSGGHSEFVLMKGHGKFERLGETLDDAAGEAFDKVSKMLGLGYPGGPKLAQLATLGNRFAYSFPRSMLDSGDLMLSFSGLKTSVLYQLRSLDSNLTDQVKADVAASFQAAVVDILVSKTRQALAVTGCKHLILAGGVAANESLRQSLSALSHDSGVTFHLPQFKYSLDNATMIAAAGAFRFIAGHTVDPRDCSIDPNLDIV